MEETERGNWEAAAYLKERAEPAASGSSLLTRVISSKFLEYFGVDEDSRAEITNEMHIGNGTSS